MSSVGAVFKKGRQERAASQIQAQKLESKSSPRSHHTWWDPQKYTGYPPCTILLGTSSTHQSWMGGGQTDGLYMKGPRRTHVLNVWSPQQMDPTIEGDWMIYFTSGQIHWQTPTERNTRCEVTQIIAGCVIWRVCLSQASCSFYFLAVVEWTPHRVLCRSGLLRHSGLLCHRSRNNGVMYYELKFLKLQLKISLLSNNYHSHKKQTNKTA